MEIHPHSHHSHKKWTSYLWEFLMLFLAVTLGFFVENRREHLGENKRESQYMNSILQDLQSDTVMFNAARETQEESNRMIDTLISLLKSPDRNRYSAKIYWMARLIPFADFGIISMGKTYEQMKSSGNLRLIHNPQLLDTLGLYYEYIAQVKQQGPSQMQFENRHDLYLIYNKFFDAAIFQKMMKAEEWPQMPEANPAFLTSDPAIINELCMCYQNMYTTRKVMDGSLIMFNKFAGQLILEIRRNYGIE